MHLTCWFNLLQVHERIGAMYGSVHAQLRFNGWHLKEHMHLGRSCKRELLKVHVFEDSWIIFIGENTWDVSCMIHAFSRWPFKYFRHINASFSQGRCRIIKELHIMELWRFFKAKDAWMHQVKHHDGSANSCTIFKHELDFNAICVNMLNTCVNRI